MKKSASYQEIEEAIIDLYLSIKIRKEIDVANYSKETFCIEKNRLKASTPLLTIINYIKTNIEVLIATKVSAQLNSMTISSVNEDLVNQYQGANEYERLLRRYEADIRGYISVINKLRINLTSVINRNEQLERIAVELDKKSCSQQPEVKDYQKEIQDLTLLIKTYERNNLKIPVLEKKLKKQKIELTTYQEKIRSYSKKIEEYERDVSMTRTITLAHCDSLTKVNQDETVNPCELVNYNDTLMANTAMNIMQGANSVKSKESVKAKSNSIIADMKLGRHDRNQKKAKAKMIPKCNSIVYLKDHFKNTSKQKGSNGNMSFSSRDEQLLQRDKSMSKYATLETTHQIHSNKENDIQYTNSQNDNSMIRLKPMGKRLCKSGTKGKRTYSRTQSLLGQ